MYGIFTYIYHENQPNVGKYTIHGSYGYPKQLGAPLFIAHCGIFCRGARCCCSTPCNSVRSSHSTSVVPSWRQCQRPGGRSFWGFAFGVGDFKTQVEKYVKQKIWIKILGSPRISGTLPPIIIWKSKMGPCNSSYLSNIAIFHFHDYGRKGT